MKVKRAEFIAANRSNLWPRAIVEVQYFAFKQLNFIVIVIVQLLTCVAQRGFAYNKRTVLDVEFRY